MLQNFADAGKALYRVARKYAIKVKIDLIAVYIILTQYQFLKSFNL